MNSEGSSIEPEQPWYDDGDAAFRCREDPPVTIDDGWILQELLYAMPLRAGFTDEVLTRIQTPMP